VPKVRLNFSHDVNGCFLLKQADFMQEVPMEAEPKEGEAPAPGVEAVEEKGAKKLFTAVSLAVTASSVGSMSPEEMVAFQAKEAKMAAADREIVEKDAKKNELETYVYDMRDKLTAKFKPYVTPADADSFNSKLDEIESWLYSDEGSDGTLAAYQTKLESVQKVGEPIAVRYFESQERPLATSDFNNVLESAKKFLNKQGIDEAYFHLSDDDWAKIRSTHKEFSVWLKEEQYKQGALPLTSPVAVTAANIKAKMFEFSKIVDPIMNKSKPKVEAPKVEVKKEEPKKEEASAATGDVDVEMEGSK
jgi:heat shock protein 4